MIAVLPDDELPVAGDVDDDLVVLAPAQLLLGAVVARPDRLPGGDEPAEVRVHVLDRLAVVVPLAGAPLDDGHHVRELIGLGVVRAGRELRDGASDDRPLDAHQVPVPVEHRRTMVLAGPVLRVDRPRHAVGGDPQQARRELPAQPGEFPAESSP
ncbi:hypothetical protein ER308_14760 [Egibacter rhizosphaerae]|uniref:Uncharacterized protein n=1 Tax=Egibacter rhizosphaerae TaxID=1670831 RepID=A0A411YHV7_9ACTN|nr:hypothetical protein ER308_14760 [Egibacter rhizosphaerae]